MHNSITHVCHITILDMFRALTCPSSGGTTAQAVIALCIKVGWRKNPILWRKVEKTWNGELY